jgi:hypothetical protein
VARETLKEFLRDTPYGDSDKIDYKIDGTGTASGNDGPTEGLLKHLDDLGTDPSTGAPLLGDMGLLGSFTAYLTNIYNFYNLKPGNEEGAPTTRGEYLEPAQDQGVVEPFLTSTDPLTIAMDTGGRGSPQFSNLGDILSKVGNSEFAHAKSESEDSDPDPRSGHTLLKSIVGQEFSNAGTVQSMYDAGSNDVTKQTDEIFLSHNRFAPSYVDDKFSAFADPYGGSPEGDAITSANIDSTDTKTATMTSQVGYGDFNTHSKSIPLEQLKSLGASLMMKAARMDDAITPGESDDPSAGIPEDSSYLDSAQTYKAPTEGNDPRIPVGNLRARYAYGFPTEDDPGLISTRAGAGEFFGPDSDSLTGSGMSFGQLYTPDNPFESENSQEREIVVAQAAAAVLAMMEICNQTWSEIDLGDSASTFRGPHYAGQPSKFAAQAKFQLFKNISLAPTQHNYQDCVTQGFLIMFGQEMGAGESEGTMSSVGDTQMMQESPGFWLSVSRKILRDFASLGLTLSGNAESFTSNVAGNVSSVLKAVSSTSVLNILNAMATIGDITFKARGQSKIGKFDGNMVPNTFNVDQLPDSPGTRISKSRSGNGQTSLSLAWRGNSVPSMYMIPRNVILAAFDMGTLSSGQNPLKGHLATDLIRKTYINVEAQGPGARIPGDIVRRFEDSLDSEYVPFYFHDLRTNEIVAFHAFLSSLTDTYSPDWVSTTGYGRIDPVKIYRSTRRSLSLSFIVAATSKEDFDEMWFKINKLTSLVYPQWTQGTPMITKEKGKFIQPFSQVLGASPIIRLRIGDVIKSNYSKFNLARIFGAGEDEALFSPELESGADEGLAGTTIGDMFLSRDAATNTLDSVFMALFGSPLALGLLDPTKGAAARILRAVASQALINGFVNPLGAAFILSELSGPDQNVNIAPGSPSLAGLVEIAASALRASQPLGAGYGTLSFPILKGSMDAGYKVSGGNGEKIRITRPLSVIVSDKQQSALESPARRANSGPMKGYVREADPKVKTVYKVTVIDFNASLDVFGKVLEVSHEDLMPNPNAIFNTYVLPALNIAGLVAVLLDAVVSVAATTTGIPSDELDLTVTTAGAFMKAENNPVVKAFESNMGRGLAGAITRLDYTWLDADNTWEIDWNSRAPIMAKVTLGFDAIHDIPPGLDHSGYNRAPLYNVGSTMHSISGDVYSDNGDGSKDAYTRGGASATQSTKSED